MVGAGVYPDDYVIVRRQQTAKNGEIVIALLDGKNNLKKLVKTNDGYILLSMNKGHQEDYPDITLSGERNCAFRELRSACIMTLHMRCFPGLTGF